MKRAPLSNTTTESHGGETDLLARIQDLVWLKVNSDENFLLLDLSFKVITFNRSLHKLWLNFVKDICEGDLILTRVPAHWVMTFESCLLKAASGSETQVEVEMAFPDQSIHHFLVRYKPACDEFEKVTGVSVFLTDITESAHLKAKESEEKYRTLIEHAFDSIIIYSSLGAILDFNESACACLGYSNKEFPKINIHDLFFPHDILESRLHTPKMKPGQSITEFRTLKRKNGSPVEMEITTKVLPDGTCMAVARDITEWKESEQEKEFDSNNLKALINNTNDLMWSVDCDLRLITFNKAFEEMMKRVMVKPLKTGSNIFAIGFDEEKLGRWTEFYHRALSGESFTETECTDSPIHTWSEISFYPILNEDTIVGTACYSRNITETKKATQLLRKAYSMNSAILESITDGFVTVDKNWVVNYWNKEAESIMDVPRENIIGKNIWEVFPVAIGLKFYSEIRKALDEQVPQQFEDFFPPLGIWIDVSAYPSEEGLSIYFKNISERKMADEKIRAAKQRYEMVAMATNDAIYEWDMIADTIYWNEGYETLFGHKRTGDTMPTGTWIENLHPGEKEKLFAITYDAFKKKLTSLTRELRFKCADGSYKIVFDKLIIRYDTDGQPTRIFGAMQDITDRRQNETAIRELNAQLNKRAEELLASNNELERFAYVASHDLQEPLRMVSSFLQLLEKKYKSVLDETADQYITYAVDGAERMKRLILDLLEYSRVGTNKEVLSEIDMGTVVSKVFETFTSKLHDTCAITKVQLMPVVKANKIQMIQLLQNLVGNSLKYNTSAVPEIEIGCKDKDDCWEFFVKDNGIGIEKKFFEKVFVIFQRLHNKNRFSGTGIGLAICKKIVEKHGGNIWIESVVGAGTTFFFTIKK
jgi:PAS domain S-box-containing protein